MMKSLRPVAQSIKILNHPDSFCDNLRRGLFRSITTKNGPNDYEVLNSPKSQTFLVTAFFCGSSPNPGIMGGVFAKKPPSTFFANQMASSGGGRWSMSGGCHRCCRLGLCG